MENKFIFRIDRSYGSDFIDLGFTKKINNEAQAFLKSAGIKSDIMEFPELGGGIPISPVLQILQDTLKFFSSILLLIKNNNEYFVKDAAPTFLLFVNYNSVSKINWEWEDDTSEKVRSLILHSWQLVDHMQEKYPIYQFEVLIWYYMPNFHYRLHLDFSSEKGSVGALLKLLKPLKIRSNIFETISVGSLIKQTISNTNKNKTKTFYYFKGSKMIKLSPKNRNIQLKKTFKGNIVSAISSV